MMYLSSLPEVSTAKRLDRGHGAWMLCLARLALGGIFLTAALAKARDPLAFSHAIGGFKLLHESILLSVGLIMIWIELLCGALLVAGLWPRAAAGLCTGLLTLFLGAILSGLARGLNADCGCFGGLLPEGLGALAVLRTLILLAIALTVTLRGGGRLTLTR